MSHRFHNHTKPLKSSPQQPDGYLPKNRFVGLTGVFDHSTLIPYRDQKPDDNHVYLWVRVPTGAEAGRYEVAVNVHSGQQDLMYLLQDEAVPPTEWPEPGASTQAAVSYKGLELEDKQFSVVQAGELRSLVLTYASQCSRLCVYGLTYGEGAGLHDVRFNAGQANQDGALVFYFDSAHGGPIARWLFLKFQSDRIG